MLNILAHQYDQIDAEIVWDAVSTIGFNDDSFKHAQLVVVFWMLFVVEQAVPANPVDIALYHIPSLHINHEDLLKLSA